MFTNLFVETNMASYKFSRKYTLFLLMHHYLSIGRIFEFGQFFEFINKPVVHL